MRNIVGIDLRNTKYKNLNILYVSTYYLTKTMAAAVQSTPSDSCAERTLIHSGSKCPEMSNFYGCQVEVGGLKYPSVEHAYQASKCKDQTDWLCGGRYSDYAWVLARVNEGRSSSLSVKHWKAKNMIGILAKWVISRPYMFGLEYVGPTDPAEFEAWTVAESTWFPIFDGKFQGVMLDNILKTKGQLVEFDRFAKPDTKWGAKVSKEDGSIVGKNVMGQLLTRYRDSKRPKRKRDEGPSTPVKVSKVMTQAEVLAAAFKEAEASGDMIVIDDDDDFLPHNWDSMSAKEKATYGYSHNFSHVDWMKLVQPSLDALAHAKAVPCSPQKDAPVAAVAPGTFAAAVASAPLSPLIGDSSDDEEEEHDGMIECSSIGVTFSRGTGGLEKRDMKLMQKHMGGDLYKVKGVHNGEGVVGRVLVVRNFHKDHSAAFEEMCNTPMTNVDTQMINPMNGKPCHKSTWTTIYSDKNVVGVPIASGVVDRCDSQYPLSQMPEMQELHNCFKVVGDLLSIDQLKDLECSANFFGIKKANEAKLPKVATGLTPRIDPSDLMLLLNYGAERVLCVCAYSGPQPAGPRMEIRLGEGDLVVFDKNSCGFSHSGLHIRHWASGGRSDEAYITKVDKEIKTKLCKKLKKMAAKGREWDQTDECENITSGHGPTIANIVSVTKE